jgi:hypothetical protein
MTTGRGSCFRTPNFSPVKLSHFAKVETNCNFNDKITNLVLNLSELLNLANRDYKMATTK